MTSFLFKSALIVDGISPQPYQADLLVKEDKIAQIGRIPAQASDQVIDAQGLVLAPGFIDAHGHSDYHLLILPSAESKLLQGVTTEIGGNCGYSPAPVFGELKKEREKNLKQEYQIKTNFRRLKDYLERLEENGLGINFAPLVGYNTVRASVMGFENRPPTDEEMEKIRKEINLALEQGAFGLSAGLIYPPGCYVQKEELVQALEPVKESGGVFACHIRSEGRGLIEAVEEFLEIGIRSGAKLQLSHLKTSQPENWHKLDRVFELIEDAQKKGLEIKADRYPYLASFTSLSALLPDWVFEGGEREYRQKLTQKSPEIISELKKRYSVDYWEKVYISQCFSQKNRVLEGNNLAQLAEKEKIHPAEYMVNLLREEKLSPSAIFETMNFKNLERIYQKPWVMVGSDAGARSDKGVLAQGKPHPRAYGTFPRFFARFVREKSLISLSEAVRKTSALAGEHFRIEKRGKLAIGYYADLVLFDLESISDRANYQNPFLAPVGIKMVVVNGKIAVKDGKIINPTAGRVLRK